MGFPGLEFVWWRKVERPPLVLTVWGGRTRAWLRWWWWWRKAERPLLVFTAWDGRTWVWLWRKIEHPPLILTVLGGRTRAHLDDSPQASSPYLNCIGWQDKPSVDVDDDDEPLGSKRTDSRQRHHTVPMSSYLPHFPYCFVMVTWSIESRKTQNGHSGARLVKWHQVPSYYDTVLCNNSRLLHSTVKKKKKKKKWQTRHQVPRCWPHSTVCQSPGHGIWSTWANGDIPMYIWPDNRNTGRFLEPPFRSQEPFPLPETEVTSSKMAGGSGNGSWLLNGGSKNLPILLVFMRAWGLLC